MARGNGYSNAYTATLARLKAQKGYKSALGLKVLMWVLYSERPLRAEELCHALGVEIGSADRDLENVPTLRTLITSCLGLVVVEASSSTVRLVHFTLQEHLSSDPTLFHSPHSAIAEVCLTYLNSRYVQELSPTLCSAPSKMALLEYASFYWGEHVRKGMTANVKVLALRLLDRFDEHISAQLLLFHYNDDKRSSPNFDMIGGPSGFTGLHGVAFFGIVEIFAPLLEMKNWDFDAADYNGSTALTWAARRGQEEMVEMLLEREDVNPNHVSHGQTPLMWAAQGGHEEIVKMLLEREYVNPNHAGAKIGRTPLSLAAKNGHEGVVKILLSREEVNPDQADIEYGRTPLSWAAEGGYGGVVKMLLERDDVDPDHADIEYGQTPLSWAAGNGHEEVVNILLERDDVDPDHADTQNDITPLSWAAKNGHEGVVNILLEREDVNPDHAGAKIGRTPLSLAAKNGHEGVVKILLSQEDVNPDHVDIKYGLTPLSLAAAAGHEGVVNMLLERNDVNPDHAGTYDGRTALSWAAGNGCEGVVEMLLKRKEVNPDLPDTRYGLTPLSWAVGNSHFGVIKILSERHDARTAMPDGRNKATPPASSPGGRDGVMSILLGPGNLSSNAVDRGGQASIPSTARLLRDECLVEMQFRFHDPNPNITDFSQPSLPLADADGRETALDPKVPLSMSPGNDLSSTELSNVPQPSSMWPLKFPYSPWKFDAHTNNTRSTLPITVDRYWVIGSCVCILAFLAYRKNLHN